MMHFGLTQREFVQYTQSAQPNVLKPGIIDEVVKVLRKHFDKCEDERIQSLAEAERKRMRNLEAETELKHIHLCIKPQLKTKSKKSVKKSEKPYMHWMDTQKPGAHPAPDSGKLKKTVDSELLIETNDDILNQSTDDHKNQYEEAFHSNQQKATDPDACLHLPLGMVRDPTPRTRRFLSAQTSESLYGMANLIVYSPSEEKGQKH
ncbi:hypothetical protein KSF78_0003328 [Schistosoma japonicum]|uniref:Uncharacterized protein n=1 Tax=Schistosoma japonicum TaxID=6182 RepID=C1LJB1_SCHJA|nr:hypothetical protein KSF78_0003328 [Schistosoma japonicum]CAX74789.1 hypothetical protein [Schistosoma japonicum]CAX74790.1 hypothetical protein [Schistosoma japonicum]